MKSTLPIEVISSVDGGGGNFWIFFFFFFFFFFVDTFCNFVRIYKLNNTRTSLYQNIEKIVCFRCKYTKLSARLAHSHSFRSCFLSVSSLYVLRNKSTNTRTYCTEFLPTRYYWLIEKNHMFPTQKCQNFGSLAIIYVFFSSFCFSGRNKSSWTRPYHECYEHKDIIYCTDKPCDLSTEYWGD